jgi:hypothetical protein
LRARAVPVATLLISILLSACAAGIDYEGEIDPALLDASTQQPVQEPPVVDAGLVLPPFDSGSIVPVLPMSPPRDAGSTSSVRDAGSTTPRDSGSAVQPTPTPTPMDSGSSTPTPTPVDTGAPPPPPVDSGSTAGANMCSAAPSYSTASSCGKCTCMKCATQVTTCFASSETATNATCATVHACAEKNHCAGEACYCGSSLLCLNPDGACKAEIETAANASGPLDVQNASNDANSAVARARAVGDCQTANCRSECGL